MRRGEASSMAANHWSQFTRWLEAGTSPAIGAIALGAFALGLCGAAGCGSSEDGGNRPPEVIEAMPQVGTALAEGRPVGIIVEDPNPGDMLYFRWLIDYFPFNPDVSRIKDLAAVPSGERVVFEPDCMEHGLSREISDHRLVLLVSDRPFTRSGDEAAASDEAVEDAGAEGNVLRLTWPFMRSCS